MNRAHYIANAILWGAAIVASAIVGAPAFFTVGLLPALAACALLATWSRGRSVDCAP